VIRQQDDSPKEPQDIRGDDEVSDLEWSLIHGFGTPRGVGTGIRRRHMTKSQYAYAALRRAIVTHALPPAVPLDELTLLDIFPFGRTPLREALKQLSYEGLLYWPAHQAPVIRDINAHEMRYLFETRQLLEPEVAFLAAQRATPYDVAQLQAICNRLVAASRTGSVYESVELDYALHAALGRATQNRLLAEASDNLNLQSLRLWYRAQQGLGISTIHKSHTELVDAVRRGDATAARTLAIEHIESSRSRQQLLLNVQH
jgi:DNA-binding GntR family transcriptional regulator